MRLFFPAVAAAAILSISPGAQLTPATLRAFDRYVALTEARMSAELSGKTPFLWIDRVPAGDRQRHLADLAAGRVVTSQLTTRDGDAEISAEDGMLHHWIGTVVIPGTSLDRVRAFVQDYDRYAERFAPMIQRSRLVSHTGDRFVVSMRTMTKKVITVVVDADYTIDYRPLGAAKMFTKSVTTNVHEVENAGTADERRHPADARDAFLWRLNTYCSFEERRDGVYEQCESISLTRAIPWGVRFIVRPFVTGVPRETLTATLGAVRSNLAR